MTELHLQKPAGRHCEIIPKDDSHYVLVDGVQWARFDLLEKAETLRNSIIEAWAQHYEALAAELA